MTPMRHLQAGDEAALTRFFASVPHEDRIFFKEDLSDPQVIERWITSDGGRRVVAIGDDGEIAGTVAVVPGLGSADHVGEIRLVVGPSARGAGLGRALARRVLLEALELELKIIYVEVISQQASLVRMFQSMGFQAEALLPDFVRDGEGKFHDLMLLVHQVDEVWAQMRTVGLDEELG